MLDRLDRRLENEVPYASSVTSLVNLNIPIGNDEGFDVANPFEEVIPTELQELAEKKAFILNRESLVNALVSEDATETFLVLNLEQNSESLEAAMNIITPPAMNIFNDSEFQSDKYIICSAGLSYTEYEEGAARGSHSPPL